MIVERDKVRAAFLRAMALHHDEDVAVLAVAQALGVDPQAVAESITLDDEELAA